MALDIGLVDHVEPVLVAQVVEPGIVGVVGAAHCVDVVCLHQLDVPPHRRLVDRAAPHRIELVTIDADDGHRGAVDEQLVPTHLHRAEAGELTADVDDLPRRCEQLDLDRVADGMLVAPRIDPGYLDPATDALALEERARQQLADLVAVFETCDLYRTHPGEFPTPERPDGHQHGPSGREASTVRGVHAHLDIEQPHVVDGSRRGSARSDGTSATWPSDTLGGDTRRTLRCSPGNHHWSWSSSHVPADHCETTKQSSNGLLDAPVSLSATPSGCQRTRWVMSKVDDRRLSVPNPTSTPSTKARTTLSAEPTSR
ncbi:MAG: hypothetical protein R2698_08595 [Microthrixaceae bacterium]